VSTTDERDYSTLLEVQKELDAAYSGLYSDFNAFTLVDQPKALQGQVIGRQVAFDIINPLKIKVDSVVDELKAKVGRIQ